MVGLPDGRFARTRFLEASGTNRAEPKPEFHHVRSGIKFRQADAVLVARDVLFHHRRIPYSDDFEPILWLQNSSLSGLGILFVVVDQKGDLVRLAVPERRSFRMINALPCSSILPCVRLFSERLVC